MTKRTKADAIRPWRVVWLFAAVILLQGALSVLSVDLLSAMRASVAAQALWSNARHDAMTLLRQSALSGQADPAALRDALAVPLALRAAREALETPQPDFDRVRALFVAGGLAPQDVPGVIRLYRWLGRMPNFADVVAAWASTDAGIDELLALSATPGASPDGAAKAAAPGAAALAPGAVRTRGAMQARLQALDQLFAEQESVSALRLGEAARVARPLLIGINVTFALGLTLGAMALARRSLQAQARAQQALSASEARLECIVASTHDAMLAVDEARRIVVFNGAAEALLGCSAAQVLGQPVDRFLVDMPPGALFADADAGAGAGAATRTGAPAAPAGTLPGNTHAWRIRRADATPFDAEVSISGLRVPGAHRLVLMTLRDVTERNRARAELEAQALQHRLISAFGQSALTSSDLGDLMVQAAEAAAEGLRAPFCRLLELSADEQSLHFRAGTGWAPEWTGHLPYSPVEETEDRFILGAREAIVIDQFQPGSRLAPSPSLLAHGIRSGVEVLICGAEGLYGVLGAYSTEPARFTQASANFLQGLTHALAAAIDRQHVVDRLAYLAQFDVLTGLPNRSLYRDRLWHTLVQAERTRATVGVMFVDLDRFKVVNDTLGHEAGDRLLAEVARRLSDCVRSGDTVARLSGDEFALVLPRLAHADDAGSVAQRIIDTLSRSVRLDAHDVYVSASVGISIYPVDGTDPDELLKNADTAMYRAKEQGRSGFALYRREMNELAVERLQLEADLRRALERGEFVLHYQPKVDLATGAISGFEALLRWLHPQRGMVPPLEFIGILENLGLIVPVGAWVVRSVCEQIARWQAQGVRPRPVAVNLSARQFQDQALDASIAAILAETGIDPALLELELTESMLMIDAQGSARMLQAMKAAGVRLSIDDFGTGHSSLAYLKRFPIDALKIDRGFVRDITTDSDDAAITLAIIGLAHSLNLTVVAEGVETAEQLRFLRDHGCDEMQGFHFSRPLTTVDATRLLVEDRRLVLPPPARGRVELAATGTGTAAAVPATVPMADPGREAAGEAAIARRA